MEKYLALGNNYCESINSLIKSLTPLHLKVSIHLFRNILFMLFNRVAVKRTRNNMNQALRFMVKRTVSDYMLELSKTFKNNFIEYDEYIKIKHLVDEKMIFSLNDNDDNDNENLEDKK